MDTLVEELTISEFLQLFKAKVANHTLRKLLNQQGLIHYFMVGTILVFYTVEVTCEPSEANTKKKHQGIKQARWAASEVTNRIRGKFVQAITTNDPSCVTKWVSPIKSASPGATKLAASITSKNKTQARVMAKYTSNPYTRGKCGKNKEPKYLSQSRRRLKGQLKLEFNNDSNSSRSRCIIRS